MKGNFPCSADQISTLRTGIKYLAEKRPKNLSFLQSST